jgi:hypothetical protein
MTWIDFILYAVIFALTAIIYSEVLTAPGMILGWWDKLIHRYIKPEYLLKPLGDCVYCLGGQVALWGYLIVMIDYSALQHVLFVSFTIGLIHIYCKIWN